MGAVTVLEIIQRSTEFLTRKGVEAPRLQSELLLSHVLKIPRMRLYLEFERVVSGPDLDQVRELVRRRSLREPLQQIVGSACFVGLDLAVTRDVLVPRPETELLAERGWEFLNCAMAEGWAQAPHALDFGTGSGCLAIALAVKCPAAHVVAVDCSASALEIATRNAATHGVSGRIQFLRTDSLEGLAPFPAEKLALFISNPPYIPRREIAALQIEVRDFEPHVALDGGEDGLDYYRLLAARSAALLHPRGRIMLEFGDGQAEAVRDLFVRQNWIVESILEDYTRRPRILIGRR
jgi:release factor glutamine methyltransferase